MKTWRLYHGTSSKMYESIERYGFVPTGLRFHNWLAPQGLYCVLNRPLIAYRFAKIASRNDLSSPVLLEIIINSNIEQDNILNLTSDQGLNRLYCAYLKGQALFKMNNKPKFEEKEPFGYQEYLDSVKDDDKKIIEKLNHAHETFSEKPRNFNWDSFAILIMIEEEQIKLIIAAIQEGNTFNETFARHRPSYHSSPIYKGIRCRDHIEICLTDYSLIRSSEKVNDNFNEFHNDFINWIINIDAIDKEN